MKASEIFDAILKKVCEVCEVDDVDLVMQDRRIQRVVNARCLAVQYMRRAVLSNDDIAYIVLKKTSKEPVLGEELLKKKAKSIDTMFKSYSDRCLQSYAFRLMSKEISIWCRAEIERLLSEE